MPDHHKNSDNHKNYEKSHERINCRYINKRYPNSLYLLGLITLLSAQSLFHTPSGQRASHHSAEKESDVQATSESKTNWFNAGAAVPGTGVEVRQHTQEFAAEEPAAATSARSNTVSGVDATSVDATSTGAASVDASNADAINSAPAVDLVNVESANVVEVSVEPLEGSVFYDGTGDSHTVVSAQMTIPYMTLMNSATAALESGGVSHATLTGSSAISMTGSARLSQAELSGSSRLTMRDEAEATHLSLGGASTIEVSGNSQIAHLNLTDRAEGKILDGTFSFVSLAGESQAHLMKLEIDGGSFVTPEVSISGGAVAFELGTAIHVYARDIAFADGTLTGMWADGTPFKFALILTNEAEGLATVPGSLPSEIIFHQVQTSAPNEL